MCATVIFDISDRLCQFSVSVSKRQHQHSVKLSGLSCNRLQSPLFRHTAFTANHGGYTFILDACEYLANTYSCQMENDSKHSIFYLHLIGTKITVHRTHFLKLKQFNHNYSFDAHLKVVYEILCSA